MIKVVEKGHVYHVESKQQTFSQKIIFFKDLPQGDPSNHDGILCQDLLRVLLDRINELNAQVPCVENVAIINNLREALILFETRAARRSLEKAYAKTGMHVEQLPVRENGHVFKL